MRRRAAAALAAPLSAMLLVSGCSSIPEDWKTPAFMKIGEEKVDERLPEVSGEVGKEPKLDFPDIEPPKEQLSGVVEKGGGGEGTLVRADDMIVADVVDYSWTGKGKTKKTQSTYEKKTPVLLELKQLPDELRRDLVDNPVGSRIVYVFPPQEAQPGQPAPPKGSSVSVVDIQGRYGKGDVVEGEQTTDGGGDLPTVKDTGRDMPDIKIPDTDPPKDLKTVDLIEGDGPEVEKSQQIVAQYTGVTWKDGKVFDTTWDDQPKDAEGAPASFPIGAGQVIKGWDQGLVGKKVGSRVLMVIPEDLAYGKDAAKSGSPEGTLVFVVDILGAVDSAPPLDEAGKGEKKDEKKKDEK